MVGQGSANVSRPEIASAFNHNWWATNLPEQMGKISLDKIFYSLGVNKKQSASWVSPSQSKGQGRNVSRRHRHRQAQRRWPWAEGTGCSFPFMEHSVEAAHAWNQVSVGVSRPLPQVPAQDQPREHLQPWKRAVSGRSHSSADFGEVPMTIIILKTSPSFRWSNKRFSEVLYSIWERDFVISLYHLI